ncbi:MAG: ABC-F family ATP-binding cassette domain-containing protein [Bdellovibrionales bacterium]|nr:ABC-F family ATP-binding cassette domain-containing protein [Bdellovibrionales bacterium]
MFIQASSLTYLFPNTSRSVLAEVNAQFDQSEAVLIRGRSGSGKSTLLKALAGLAPRYLGGTLYGSVRKSDSKMRISYLPQLSEDHFVCDTLNEEVLMTLWLRGLSDKSAETLWNNCLLKYSIGDISFRSIDSLSGGEKRKASLILSMLKDPHFLILDEPLSQLDPFEREQMMVFLKRLQFDHGVGLIVADHDQSEWNKVGARTLDIETTTKKSDDDELHKTKALVWKDFENSKTRYMEIKEVSYVHSNRLLFRPISFDICSHEIIRISGRNGSGKTTLLRILCNFIEPHKGQIKPSNSYRELDIAYVPQNPSQFFLTDTLEKEFELTHKLKNKHLNIENRSKLLEHFGLDEHRLKHPLDMSVGQRQRAAISVALYGHPDILVLDEPTHGLDPLSRDRLVRAVFEYVERGMTLVFTTHDDRFANMFQYRDIQLMKPIC